MDDFTNIFDPLDSQTASDEDQGLATAGEILVKLAEEEGIDLDQLSETELLGLVNTLRGDGTTNLNDPEPRKEASQTMDENQITEAQFDALVMQETAKVAAAHELDIASLSIEDLTELRAAVAEEIAADPDAYFAKTAAEEEFQAKVAEADYMGRLMAHSFADELGLSGEKIARAPVMDPGSAEFKALPKAQQDAVMAERARVARGAGKSRAPSGSGGGFAAIDRKAVAAEKNRVSDALGRGRVAGARKSVKDYLAEHVSRPLGRASLTAGRAMGIQNRGVAKAVGGGTLAAGALGLAGAGYAGARHIARAGARDAQEKRSFDELAAERAAEILTSMGIDPSTGEKIASSEAEIDEALNVRALELLEEAGWTIGE